MLDPDKLTEMTVHELLQCEAMVSFRDCGTHTEFAEREDDIVRLRTEMAKRGFFGGKP